MLNHCFSAHKPNIQILARKSSLTHYSFHTPPKKKPTKKQQHTTHYPPKYIFNTPKHSVLSLIYSFIGSVSIGPGTKCSYVRGPSSQGTHAQFAFRAPSRLHAPKGFSQTGAQGSVLHTRVREPPRDKVCRVSCGRKQPPLWRITFPVSFWINIWRPNFLSYINVHSSSQIGREGGKDAAGGSGRTSPLSSAHFARPNVFHGCD